MAQTFDTAQHKGLMVRIGTMLIGLLFAVSGALKIGRFAAIASVLGTKGIPLPEVALALVIALEVICGAALILGRQVQAAALTLAVFVIAATVFFHAFWSADAAAFHNQLNHFLKNVALVGALIVLAARHGPIPFFRKA